MKAAVYADIHKVEFRDLPINREMGKGDVKVRMSYCAICATDLHITEGLFGFSPGFVLGHEGSGTIVEVGELSSEKGFKVGDRITICPPRFCGKCYYCKSGQEQFCIPSLAEFSNLMTEYVVVNEQQCYRLPDSVGFKEAALCEPLSACLHGIDIAQIKMGNRVMISGAGGIGLIMLQCAKLQGATKITIVEPVELKRKLALELGADHAIDPKTQDISKEAMEITDNLGFDVVIECSGVPAAAPPCLKVVAKCGRIVYFAVFPEKYELPVNLCEMFFKEATINAVYGYPYMFSRAVATLEKVNLGPVIGAIYPITEVVEAFHAAKKGTVPKILIEL